MSVVYFEVFAKVKGKDRPRFTKYGRSYTPKPTKQAEQFVAKCYKEQIGKKEFIGPVGIEIYIHRKLPKSIPKKVTEQIDLMTPDIDNVAKLVMDALNGIAYKDDKQVVELNVHKMPRTKTDERLEIYVYNALETLKEIKDGNRYC